MERAYRLTQTALTNDVDALKVSITPESLEDAFIFFTSNQKVPGGGALRTCPRMLRGFSSHVTAQGELQKTYGAVLNKFLQRKLSISVYGALFSIEVDDPIQNTLALSAVGEICRRLAMPYLFLDAYHASNIMRSTGQIIIENGQGMREKLPLVDVADYAGILHIQGHADMGEYVKASCAGLISTMVNSGLFVILEAGHHFSSITNSPSLAEYVVPIDTDMMDQIMPAVGIDDEDFDPEGEL